MENKHSSTSSFKQYGQYVLLLLIAFSLGGWVVEALFERYIILTGELCGAVKVDRILHLERPNEVPIFGSSRARGGYVPSILGENYYNYGLDGAREEASLFLLEKELERNKSKETDVILNIDLGGIRKGTGYASNYLPNYRETRGMTNHKFIYNFPFFKYFGRFEEYLSVFVTEKTQITRFAERGGSFDYEPYPEKEFNRLVERGKKNTCGFSIDDELQEKFLRLIQSTDRHIFMVVVPYHHTYFDRHRNLEDAKAYLAEMDEFPNVSVIDLSAPYVDSLLIDPVHLNYDGAKIFSKILKKRMTEIKENSRNIKYRTDE